MVFVFHFKQSSYFDVAWHYLFLALNVPVYLIVINLLHLSLYYNEFNFFREILHLKFVPEWKHSKHDERLRPRNVAVRYQPQKLSYSILKVWSDIINNSWGYIYFIYIHSKNISILPYATQKSSKCEPHGWHRLNFLIYYK